MSTLPSLSKLGFGAYALLAALPLHAQQPQQPMHAPDGGTMQRIASIDIPPVPNAPFTANVVTIWTRILPDGSKAIIKNHRTVARDSAGNIFEERRGFTPDGDVKPTRLTQMEYNNPNLHERYVCDPQVHVCRVVPYSRPATLPPPHPGGRLPGGGNKMTMEDLGHKTVEELDLVGSREVTEVNQQVFGNEKPQPMVREFWYSPRLAINIITKRFDPLASASEDFTVTNIKLGEPDHGLMQPPASFRVVEPEPQYQ